MIYGYLEMYCQIMLNNLNLCCQIAWWFHWEFFSGSIPLSCFSPMKVFFVHIMDNVVILNLLSHIYFFTFVLYQLLPHRGTLENWTSWKTYHWKNCLQVTHPIVSNPRWENWSEPVTELEPSLKPKVLSWDTSRKNSNGNPPPLAAGQNVLHSLR